MDHIISSFFQPCMAELLSANSPYFFFSSPHSHPPHKITSMPSMKSFRQCLQKLKTRWLLAIPTSVLLICDHRKTFANMTQKHRWFPLNVTEEARLAISTHWKCFHLFLPLLNERRLHFKLGTTISQKATYSYLNKTYQKKKMHIHVLLSHISLTNTLSPLCYKWTATPPHAVDTQVSFRSLPQ